MILFPICSVDWKDHALKERIMEEVKTGRIVVSLTSRPYWFVHARAKDRKTWWLRGGYGERARERKRPKTDVVGYS